VRVVIDANIFLSYLIYPKRTTATSRLVTHVIAGNVELVFPPGVAEEIRAKVREKPYFRERIDPGLAEDLLALIGEVAFAPNMDTAAPVKSRDPKDQYLLDAAAGDDVEFLITGDGDLLDIVGPSGFPLIVTPAQFLYLMEQSHGS